MRSLGNNYFLVQCNAVQLQPDDTVTLLRQGQEVGSGRVMRQEGSVCSILLTRGEAQRLDLVVLTRRHAAVAERGPSLPSFGASSPPPAPRPATVAAKAQTNSPSYFNSIHASGSVYNLNSGQYLTRP
jgi:hypothetical protein